MLGYYALVFIVGGSLAATAAWLASRASQVGVDVSPVAAGRVTEEDIRWYSAQLDHGYSLSIKANNTDLSEEDREAAIAEATGPWLKTTRDKLITDFGHDRGYARFNFPSEVREYGTSRRKEHEARLRNLEKMIGEMRSGALMYVSPRASGTAKPALPGASK